MGKGEKYYVVWSGREPGIYTDWATCRAQVHGVAGARYKSYPTREAAEAALASPPPPLQHKAGATPRKPKDAADLLLTEGGPDVEAWAVDAACSGNPGAMEYRGVDILTGRELFHFGPVLGTNNVGEFLAIVHALALQQQAGTTCPIYSDSRNALLWVKKRKCNTRLARTAKTAALFDVIGRAERWLQANGTPAPLRKWDTARWGEIPADFGRKR